ncbi:hypothetical protein GG344DRAFT_77532 [Lentinula edodes]|nr:hypothetical protein GG344DRAFT_77532 [Lentinula edodes]
MSVSTDEVLKMLWSTYGGVETLHLNVIAQYETGGGRDVRVDWNVRVFLREGQHMESECEFLMTYTRWLLTVGVMLLRSCTPCNRAKATRCLSSEDEWDSSEVINNTAVTPLVPGERE